MPRAILELKTETSREWTQFADLLKQAMVAEQAMKPAAQGERGGKGDSLNCVIIF